MDHQQPGARRQASNRYAACLLVRQHLKRGIIESVPYISGSAVCPRQCRLGGLDRCGGLPLRLLLVSASEAECEEGEAYCSGSYDQWERG